MAILPQQIRLGLRNRVVLGFGLLAFCLAAVLAVAVWWVVSHFLVDQRVATAHVDTAINAAVIEQALNDGRRPAEVLGGLPSSDWQGAALYYRGVRFTAWHMLRTDLPASFTNGVRDGTPDARQFEVSGERYVVAGVPLSGQGDAYFELFTLSDVTRTVTSLGIMLAGGVVATTLLGLLFGVFASRRVLRPLAEVTEAASAIARGDRDVRIYAVDDPDLGELARSFNETAAALQRRVVADARFAGDVSHELRTPLTTMLNSMQLLQNRRESLPEGVREPLDLLEEDLERFRRLVVDLLEISRQDGGDASVFEKVRIADLVRRAADTAAARPVTVVNPGVDGLTLRADKRRLERVIANLVDNAESHGDGCVTVRVMKSDRARGNGGVRIEVDDNGPGVPEDRRERIFERFARDGSGQSPGVGLGLAIVARHVRAHGGQIHVEDRPGGGGRFVVELPAV